MDKQVLIADGNVKIKDTICTVKLGSNSDYESELLPLYRVAMEIEGRDGRFFGFIAKYDNKSRLLVVILSSKDVLDRRKQVRVDMFNEEVILGLTYGSLGRFIISKLLNLSEGGIAFKTDEKFNVGSNVIYMFNKTPSPFQVYGEIVWMRQVDEGYAYGVQFGTMSDIQKSILRSYVEKRVNESIKEIN